MVSTNGHFGLRFLRIIRPTSAARTMLFNKMCFYVVFCCIFLTNFLTETRPVESNHSCEFPRNGTCIDVWKCLDYANLLKTYPRPWDLNKKLHANICGLVDQTTPKVCCLNVDTQLIMTDLNYRRYVRITQGASASPREFPWMAYILYKTDDSTDDKDAKCGGTLINQNYVLTAAHCVDDNTALGVRLGEYNLETPIDCINGLCDDPVQNILIDKIVIHPQYSPRTLINDIALIKLVTPANLTYNNVKAVHLPKNNGNEDLTGKFLTVTGWGVTETGNKSMILRKASVPVEPLEKCMELYGNIVPITENQICAGGYEGRDACSGDSGGPLQYLESYYKGPAHYVQYGIVSYGPKKCGLSGHPAIYTNVKKYLSWIVDNIETDSIVARSSTLSLDYYLFYP